VELLAEEIWWKRFSLRRFGDWSWRNDFFSDLADRVAGFLVELN